jgi:hypothetical protein
VRNTSENRGEYEEARRELAVATKVKTISLYFRFVWKYGSIFLFLDPDPHFQYEYETTTLPYRPCLDCDPDPIQLTI